MKTSFDCDSLITLASADHVSMTLCEVLCLKCGLKCLHVAENKERVVAQGHGQQALIMVCAPSSIICIVERLEPLYYAHQKRVPVRMADGSLLYFMHIKLTVV